MLRIFTLVCIFWVNISFAADAVYTSWTNNNALSGYDTVAYFTQNKPVKGSKKYKTSYRGAHWLFSSAENLATFKNDPKRYAPQYGGHCAWALAVKNSQVSGDPQQWNIVDGKLYINYDKGVKNKWEKNIPGFIKVADSNWPALLNK